MGDRLRRSARCTDEGDERAVRQQAPRPTVVVRWYSGGTDKDPEVRDAKKRHKQTVVLLHALAQTLGAIAESDPSWIQNPAYAVKQSTFSDRNRDLIQLAIDQRLNGGTDETIAHDLLEAIEKNEWGGWIAADHDDVVKQLRAQLAMMRSGKTATDIPAAAIEQYDHIKGLAMKKQYAEALVELENVLTAYPANATLHEMKCEILIAKQGVKDKTAMDACARVSELAPGDPSPHIAVATALAMQGDFLGARAQLVTAGQNVANLNLGQADAWKRIVTVYLEMGSLTWAEEAIKAGKLNDPGYAMIASTRARYGLHKGTNVKPQDEGPLVAALKQASAAIYASKYAEAHKALDAIDKKWPGSAGALAFRCDLSMREGSIAGAKAYCAKALALDPDESWANYLSGVLAFRDTSAAATKAGIEKLKWAIVVDPDLGQAWRALAKAYIRAKDKPRCRSCRRTTPRSSERLCRNEGAVCCCGSPRAVVTALRSAGDGSGVRHRHAPEAGILRRGRHAAPADGSLRLAARDELHRRPTRLARAACLPARSLLRRRRVHAADRAAAQRRRSLRVHRNIRAGGHAYSSARRSAARMATSRSSAGVSGPGAARRHLLRLTDVGFAMFAG